MIIIARDLQVGDVITEDGRVEVMSTPDWRADGRVYFLGKDGRRTHEHRMQGHWSIEIERLS